MPLCLSCTLLFAAWLLVSLAPAARKAFEDRDRPPGERRGTSILPAFPVLPLLACGLLYLVGADSRAALVIVGLHAAALVAALIEITRWALKLRRARR